LYGWDAADAQAAVQGMPVNSGVRVDHERHSVTLEIPDTDKGQSVEFSARN
jgi:hypothetical protein